MWLMFTGDYPINLQTQDRYTRAVSEISTEDSGSYVAASDFPTPVESTSLSYVNPEQVVMSEAVASEQPESAITPHQLVSMRLRIYRMFCIRLCCWVRQFAEVPIV